MKRYWKYNDPDDDFVTIRVRDYSNNTERVVYDSLGNEESDWQPFENNYIQDERNMFYRMKVKQISEFDAFLEMI